MSDKYYIESIEGTGAAIEVETGFDVVYVAVENISKGTKLEFYDGMDSDTAIVTAANGTRTIATSTGIVQAGDSDDFYGFTIGANTVVNIDNDDLIVHALKK